jgi:prepilin-type N-terminal cleavage/methylation domain-containing protein/prepilin-type processing-associated H-X9-DG protein
MRSSHPLHPPGKPGFTLVELLVTIAIIVVLAVLAVAGGSALLMSSRQAKCMGNLRNICAALHLYAADRGGALPETTHTAGLEGSWIYALEEYLGEFDESRICPADPQRDERLGARGTSYLLNSFIFVPETDPFGMPAGPAMNHLNRIPEPSRTLVAFVCSDTTGTGPGNDHTHSNQWDSWSAVCRDIAPDRFSINPAHDHSRGRSNYLYADGRVESMSAAEVKRRTEQGINIALPPGMNPAP